MSKGNVAAELQSGTPFPKESSTVVPIIRVSNNQLAKHNVNWATLFAFGSSVPSSVSGYLSACLFLDTNADADSQLLINEGTLSSCTFSTVAS